MGEFNGVGRFAFEASGLSSEERFVAKNEEEISFAKRAEKLRPLAEIRIRDAHSVSLVQELLKQPDIHGDINLLTAEKCEQFADKHKAYFDEGPAILAIAIALETAKRTSK